MTTAKVTTYQAPNGITANICADCEQRLASSWPRNESGEYCTVSHGLHDGECDYCDGEFELVAE